jgi:RNAse (barnase) inhibitor barstar
MYFTDKLILLKTLNGKLFLLPEKIQSKDQLLSFFCHELKFPYYFGENFDALYDCLVDLSWIKDNKIYIIHNEIPLNNSEIEASKYIKLLFDVAMFWRDNGEHEVNVLFPEKCKNKIEQFLIDE